VDREKVVREIVVRFMYCSGESRPQCDNSECCLCEYCIDKLIQILLSSPAIAIVEREKLEEAKSWLREFAAISAEEGMDATAIQVRKALADLEKGG